MDAQLKRGLLDICVLSILQRGDSYGYQIIKDTAPLLELTESTLYPILRRLEQANYVSEYAIEHNSRLRKYYHITAEGVARIGEFLQEWQDIMRVYQYIKEGYDHE
ncbi:MAG: PadR family transcriptional regulator [Clostridia bacterium]|nr:PadR family transcriptional regulator [Clostridia bacterium]